jgi:hypothetical protein
MTENPVESLAKRRQVGVVLLLLLGADLCFMMLHTINSLTPLWNNPSLNIEKDAGYSEIYQYLKYFWISLLFLVIAATTRTIQPTAWAFVFLVLLADDALGLHERAGGFIALHLFFIPPWGLRPQDIGEVLYALAAALVLSVLLGLACLWGTTGFRRATTHLLQLVVLLACFGVLVDLLHMLAQSGWRLRFLLALVEDGGEMMVVSALLTYTLALCFKRGNPPRQSPWSMLLRVKSNATFAAAA